jgi:hypothetical protein
VSGIFSVQRNTSNFSVIKALRAGPTEVESELSLDLGTALRRFHDFWILMDTVKNHGYIRAAMSTVGRSAVGAWWSLRRHSEYGDKASELQRRKLYNFYMMRNRRWDNIKDFQGIAYKLMIGAEYLRYFGQAAYQIIRDETGRPVGLDHLPGLIIPNVDSAGYFKPGRPAFIQYPSRDISVKVEFSDPRDIVYLINPDWEGSPMGGTDVESLSTYALPIDLYLQVAAREYLKNRDKPEVVYELAPDISDEAFNDFVKEMQSRQAGPSNLGRSPIAIQGEFKVHEMRPYPDALPYQESRKETREEALAVTGVSGAKLGITDAMAAANIREMRREFHEASMSPLFRLIEMGLYEQIHVREFRADGWEFKFNSPDFLSAVERATVHMRYRQMGALSPNEVRYDIGKPARPDDQGDMFDDQEIPENQGSPPEGREEEPDAPSQIGEPSLTGDDPVRGDQHDEEVRSMIGELRRWRAFALKRAVKGKSLRAFRPEYLPLDMAGLVEEHLSRAQTPEDVARIFDEAITTLEEVVDG